MWNALLLVQSKGMHIQFEAVSKSYFRERSEVSAVSDFHWSLEPGKIYGLLGRNAAGKTSLIRMLLDLVRPESGKIFFTS